MIASSLPMPSRQPPPSSPPSPSRSCVNPRAVALSAVFFLAGLQFKTLLDLFRGGNSGDVNADPGAGWAPDDLGRTESGRRRGRRRRRRRGAETKKKEKKPKKPPRFSASNYGKDFEPLPWSLPEPTPLRDQTSGEFMEEYVAAKRKAGISLPWEQKEAYAGEKVTLPLPIISLNFPKSATLTMKHYFHCGGLTAIHTTSHDGRLAVCMLENHMADRPPLDGCNTHKVRIKGGDYERGELVPIDFVSDIGLQGPPCYYSSLHDGGLEQIARHYPNATILMVIRDAEGWQRSMSTWGQILHRWKRFCAFDGSWHEGENMDYWRGKYEGLKRREKGREKYVTKYWADFYRAHTQKVREFAMRHLSLTYVEAELGEDLGEVLEGYTGVDPSCVMHCHPGPHWVREHNATDRCHPMGETPARLKQSHSGEDDEDINSSEEREDDEGSNEEGSNKEDGSNDDDEGSNNDDEVR